MPRVFNKYKEIPPDAVYIGRGSPWGNPFRIGIDGTRAEVLEMYRRWLPRELRVRARRELRGKDLVCFCAPQACHGDFLLRIANSKPWSFRIKDPQGVERMHRAYLERRERRIMNSDLGMEDDYDWWEAPVHMDGWGFWHDQD